MTYLLPTENKGTIVAGYFSVFTQEVRLGEFTIATPEFCRAIVELTVAQQSVQVPTLEGGELHVQWNPQQRLIKIGPYTLKPQEFNFFATYALRGGYLGWDPRRPHWNPLFVQDAAEYIRRNVASASEESYLHTEKELPYLEILLKHDVSH
ncbi:MAG TPA: hypothetical protein VJG90_06510 [Candidatus Nanoarchaeia archaeon]|nr:hypothetical protein [Candidatus Nanoarchaeia archaeon]